MKRTFILLSGLLLAALVLSCSATNRLTMGITEPAPVMLSAEARKIGIINRSMPSESNKGVDKIDQILSAEGQMLDKEGAEASINTLSQALREYGIFDEIKILEDQTLNKGLGIMPANLSWDEVERICQENGVDVLFSLALYDTDTKVSYKLTTMQLPNDLGINMAVPAHELTLHTLIKTGWRIYDNIDQVVADQFMSRGEVFAAGKGINPLKAYEAILNRKEAVMQRSMALGNNYGLRLLPTNRRIARDYFVRGTNNFKIARRRAQTGDWQGAAALWEREIHNPKAKIAGRACYNMAIINEINGNLKAAIDWASRSYVDYRNRRALNYLNRLKFRQSQEILLQEQLSAR
ncbi:MAG: hypothetical protein KJP14_00430 [Eudoraea sp.]|nr:hypothetical protein [Eudoraea sp.]